MAITFDGVDLSANPGPNSFRLNYEATDTLADIIAALKTRLTNYGWEIWDDAYDVMRAPCLPDVNGDIDYKYVRLYPFNDAGIMLPLYESWDNTTHVGINEAYYSISVYAGYQRYRAGVAGSLNVWSSVRYLCLHSYNPTDGWGALRYGLPTMITEVLRDPHNAVFDNQAAGAPPPVMWWMIDYACHNAILGASVVRSMYDDSTGSASAYLVGLLSAFGRYGYWWGGSESNRAAILSPGTPQLATDRATGRVRVSRVVMTESYYSGTDSGVIRGYLSGATLLPLAVVGSNETAMLPYASGNYDEAGAPTLCSYIGGASVSSYYCLNVALPV